MMSKEVTPLPALVDPCSHWGIGITYLEEREPLDTAEA